MPEIAGYSRLPGSASWGVRLASGAVVTPESLPEPLRSEAVATIATLAKPSAERVQAERQALDARRRDAESEAAAHARRARRLLVEDLERPAQAVRETVESMPRWAPWAAAVALVAGLAALFLRRG